MTFSYEWLIHSFSGLSDISQIVSAAFYCYIVVVVVVLWMFNSYEFYFLSYVFRCAALTLPFSYPCTLLVYVACVARTCSNTTKYTRAIACIYARIAVLIWTHRRVCHACSVYIVRCMTQMSVRKEQKKQNTIKVHVCGVCVLCGLEKIENENIIKTKLIKTWMCYFALPLCKMHHCLNSQNAFAALHTKSFNIFI